MSACFVYNLNIKVKHALSFFLTKGTRQSLLINVITSTLIQFSYLVLRVNKMLQTILPGER